MPLTQEQRERYARNVLVPQVGEKGQERLSKARVCVVGLGGLGSSAAYYLAAAGVGTLGLVDGDTVELSNLQRQVLHTTDRVGESKTRSALRALSALNPHVHFNTHPVRLTPGNAPEVIEPYDVVVEATDNFASKFMLNGVCLAMGKPFVTAGILALSGQAMFIVPGKTPCLRCAVPDLPKDAPTTSQLGVLGALPGILGSIEALEAIRWIVGLWQPTPSGEGLLHSVDGHTMRLRTLRLTRNPTCECAGNGHVT